MATKKAGGSKKGGSKKGGGKKGGSKKGRPGGGFGSAFKKSAQ